MSNLKTRIRNIINKYEGAYISSSGKRTIEKQMQLVKERPAQYTRTLSKVFKDFQLDRSRMSDPAYLSSVYDGKEVWLKKTILDFAKKNKGFQHLSGNALDISVRNLGLAAKKRLKDELDGKGYHVILEHIAGRKSKYNVPITQANVFHVDLLTQPKQQ